MIWWLFLVILGLAAIPSFLLMADRILDVDSNSLIRRWGVPYLLASGGVLVFAGFNGGGYLELVAWGALAGFLGTIALDVVRLIGLSAGAFPLDMPIMFGFMSLGRARLLQSRVMGRVLAGAVETGTIKEFVTERIQRIPTLPANQRVNAVAAMMGAAATLDDSTHQAVGDAQGVAIGALDSTGRQALMAAMDEASTTDRPGQPRGLPRVPFQVFRKAARQGLGLLRSSHSSIVQNAVWAGYAWHVVNGVSFGVAYTVLFGEGGAGWAIGWGVFVWLVMMVAMPAMMPILRFPAWFPAVPFVAHIAMVLPYLALTAWISESAHQASLLGWLVG